LNGNGEKIMQEFTSQNYLIVQSNVVNNIVVWDGDTTQWTPPTGSIALVQATTPAMIWVFDYTTNPYTSKLEQIIGAGDIGFTWDGSVLTTNEPKPA
jgi:hypothetical protein